MGVVVAGGRSVACGQLGVLSQGFDGSPGHELLGLQPAARQEHEAHANEQRCATDDECGEGGRVEHSGQPRNQGLEQDQEAGEWTIPPLPSAAPAAATWPAF